jgi:hypothetical protein
MRSDLQQAALEKLARLTRNDVVSQERKERITNRLLKTCVDDGKKKMANGLNGINGTNISARPMVNNPLN